MKQNQKKKQRTILPSLSLVDMIESAKVADQMEEQVFFELSPPSRPKLAVLGLDLTPDITSGLDLAAFMARPFSGDLLASKQNPTSAAQYGQLTEDKKGESLSDSGELDLQSEEDSENSALEDEPEQEPATGREGEDLARSKPAMFFLNGWQRQMLAAADVVCAPQPVLDALAEDLARTASLALAGNGDYLEDQPTLVAMAERLIRLRQAGRRVLALVSGDPLLHGLGSHLLKHLPKEELDIRPAPSLAQKMAAAMALSWEDVCQVWLGDSGALARLDSLVWSGKAICLLGAEQQSMIPFDQAIHHLLDRGVDWFGVHVLADGEKIQSLRMEEAGNSGFAVDAILFLIPNAPVRCPANGLDGRLLADHHGKYSSLAVRSCALGLMGMEPGHLVWIVGAGNGSLALEAAAIVHQGRVMAVEADPVMALTMEENRRRFGAANLDIVAQKAPDCLVSLPCPDRIFVAGGLNGGHAAAGILSAVCDALRPGGRLVAGFDLLQSLVFCRANLENAGWQIELCQLQISCSTRADTFGVDMFNSTSERSDIGQDGVPVQTSGMASDFRLVAENPVFLLAAKKPI